MKKLLLIRHAKATHQSGFADFERPLKPSGLHDAAMMAGRLRQHSLVPQILVSSPSLRTLSTADVFSQELSIPRAYQVSEIYDASQATLLDIISQLDDKYNFIGLVGHNPGIGQVLYYLSEQARDVPPGAVALIEFDADTWAAISGGTGRLVYYDSPKEDQ